MQGVHVRTRTVIHGQHTDSRGGVHRALPGHRASYQVPIHVDQEPSQDGDRRGVDYRGRICFTEIPLRRDHQ